MPLPGPTHIPPIGEQTDPTKVRVAAVIGGQLASAPARGFGLTPQELGNLQAITAGYSTTAETRNRIVNGAMQISQENGNTSGNAVGYYPADQWPVYATGPTCSTARSGFVPTTNSKCVNILVGTGKPSLAAGDYLQVFQVVEGVRCTDFLWGTASARQIIVRFWFYTNVAGTYSLYVKNSAQDRSYLAPFTVVAGTWTLVTLVVPGDTTGTWLTDTGIGLYLGFGLAMGTTYQGATGWQAGNKMQITGHTNMAATTNNTCYLSEVGLYLDPDATGLASKWQMPDEAQELAACKRYWQKQFLSFSGNVTSASNYYGQCYLEVAPRVTPALTAVNAFASNFPATAGTPSTSGYTAVQEFRTASGTGAGIFQTTITANARM